MSSELRDWAQKEMAAAKRLSKGCKVGTEARQYWNGQSRAFESVVKFIDEERQDDERGDSPGPFPGPVKKY